MNRKEINRIMKKYKDAFEALEEYDLTGKLPKLNNKNEKLSKNNKSI